MKGAFLSCVALTAIAASAAVEPFGAFRFHPPKWGKGAPQWPATNIVIAAADWTEYDRLVLDVTGAGFGGDSLRCFLAAPTGRVQTTDKPFACVPRPAQTCRWTIRLSQLPKSVRSHVGRIHFFATRPFDLDARILRTMLLKPGEEAPPLTDDPELPALRAMVHEREFVAEVRRRERCRAAKATFAEACRAAGQRTDDFLVGSESSAVKVRPRQPVAVPPATNLSMRLARGEHENLQIIVVPAWKGLKQVRVAASPLRRRLPGGSGEGQVFPQENICVVPVGYVRTANPPPYSLLSADGRDVKPDCGWWPDPILDFLPAVDVAEDDAQSFLMRVHAPEGLTPGIYEGQVSVSAIGADTVSFPLSVRVNGFTLPRTPSLPVAVTFSPCSRCLHIELSPAEITALRESPDYPVNAWKRHRTEWCDFLADYGITFGSLYSYAPHSVPQFDMLKRLRAQGRLGVFNLGYWDFPHELTDAAKAAWRKKTLSRLKRAYEAAKEEGLLGQAYIYGADEVERKYFPCLRWAVEEMKRELPGVPIATTAYDDDFGVGTPLGCIDWFTPQPDKFNLEKAMAARREGRRVCWYFACNKNDPYANVFVEYPLLPFRLFMGAQTAKYRPDGFLYYQSSIWNATNCITSGPFTDWNPRSFGNFHGDGSLTCTGPDGIPLATLRLECLRDGLEDFAYVKLLESRLAAHGRDDAWSRAARAVLPVPAGVIRDLTHYTQDVSVLESWRDGLADALESWYSVGTIANDGGTVVPKETPVGVEASVVQDVPGYN